MEIRKFILAIAVIIGLAYVGYIIVNNQGATRSCNQPK